jgi:hypothetical protein
MMTTCKGCYVAETPLPGPSSEPAVPNGTETQGSWWGLVGWSPATSHPAPQAQHAPQIRLPDQESAAVSTVSSNIPSSGNSVPEQEARTESALSAESTQVRGSSWLSPWSWYGESTPAREVAEPKEGSAEQPGALTLSESENQIAKEAPATTTDIIEPPNPIQSSITANVSGWASFFSTRSLLSKRIADTEHREEDTMEVMDIDDGNEERNGTVAPKATFETRAGKDVATRDLQGMIPAPPRSPSPSSNPKAKPDRKPEDVKGTKRTSVSPTPSRGSGRASPRAPPAPNLVLPTWEDTFCVPPRSVETRPAADSAITKTVRFVSSMLFANEDNPAIGKGKARSRDDGNFADFGRDLPRTWDTTGERLDDDVLRGCKRVVIIGIHGWFPGMSSGLI